ncbi:MurR/RpiR family transcriptional regulator [Maritalea mediterranea]|uniref:MurR/RpiR family transcriptional regulator n=1 Tax=Maritalea mediterranea TaxID=2909667 RepID=A0ABS9E4D1_9HYPH|nr:MurR/RpiR family transcriptional regulator [Maritalea mediterranea]MCF4097716.1 MurR/RpiR family transcriptional regulator [Maritalea mediterranea]
MADIIATLQKQHDELSRSEQRIAEIVFEDKAFAVNASIIELAARADVSPPTVTRFCRRLGCNSFSEFKVRLAQSAFIGTRYLEPEIKVSSAQEVIDTVMGRAQSTLNVLHENVDPAVVEKIAERILKAKMIYAFGSGGNSSLFAHEVQNRLFRLGLRVAASEDHSMQLMTASTLSEEDMVIGLSISGRNRELARALEVAAGYGAATASVTKGESLVAQASQLSLAVDLPEGTDVLRPSSARYAFLAAIDMIAFLVAIRRKDSAIEPLRRIKRQLVTYRDEDDTQVLGD